MHERRIFIPPADLKGDTLRVRGSEAHYLVRVVRLRKGDEITIFDGAGQSCRALLEHIGKRFADLRIMERRRAAKGAKEFYIAQSVLKTAAMDTLVQKCTELGASGIIGFHTVRSVTRRRTGRPLGGERVARWRRIAIEACRQCRRDFVPLVSMLDGVDELVKKFDAFDKVAVAAVCGPVALLRDVVSAGKIRGAFKTLVIVGPEGDFSEEELQYLVRHGATACTLSDAVLRAETAAIAASAVIGQQFLVAPMKETWVGS
jgi:16S rRNA (uracil1498-N3)-methyltransferase